jgi:FKBP-type peptidyl-prolyl cis-trans isomerase SlyD
MTVQKDKIVSIDYVLKDEAGSVLDSSQGSDPLDYLHGHGNIIPGLERELEGKAVGDVVDCVIKPADAYGEYDQNLVFDVAKSDFESPDDVEVGMQFEAHSEEGSRIVTVVGIDGDNVSVDTNHPLAGKALHFNVKIADVKDATAEELEHGHPHSAGHGCCGDECGSDCGDEGCGCGGCH